MIVNEYHKYEMMAWATIIQREGCMSANEYRRYVLLVCVSIVQHDARGRRYERKYELLAYVSVPQLLSCARVIQREGCMRAKEYRQYELLACVSITKY